LDIANLLKSIDRLARREQCILRALDLAVLLDSSLHIFMTRLHRFDQLADVGEMAAAHDMWNLLDSMGRTWPRHQYVPGTAEPVYAEFCFRQGTLTQKILANAEALAKSAKNRGIVRQLNTLRGKWYLQKGQHALAAESFREALRMEREAGMGERTSEELLAFANFHLGQLSNPRYEAEQLSSRKDPNHLVLAELWLAIGDKDEAKKHALKAYQTAWADGEPYVFRDNLNKARALLEKLGADVPLLPPYDPAKDEKFPWEDELETALEELRTRLAMQKKN
jgi:tetratricopeptide (TPR) repeat protein